MAKRDWWILALALVLAGAAGLGVLGSTVLQTGAWGLSFREPGVAPIGNAGVDQLKKWDAAYLGDPQEKVIYLTFDAGYENGCTGAILDALKKHQAPAVFFLVGSYIRQHPDLVRRMVAEGHTVGNHTMHHYDMSRLSDPEAFRRELEEPEALYRQTVGKDMEKYYRPPQGIYSEENLRQAQALGYRTVFWSLAYVDWKQDSQPGRDAAFAKLLPRIHPGAVVLLHSTSQTNAEILDELLTRWETLGYRFAPIGQLFSREAPEETGESAQNGY